MILIDSDILIWILRGEELYKDKFRRAAEESDGEIYITPIQYLEIISGVKKKEMIETKIFLDSLKMFSIGKDTGELAGEYVRVYKKSHSVQSADALTAAVAKLKDLKLWTNNRKHFPMLEKDELYLTE